MRGHSKTALFYHITVWNHSAKWPELQRAVQPHSAKQYAMAQIVEHSAETQRSMIQCPGNALTDSMHVLTVL